MKMTWEQFRTLFPTAAQSIHLNHAGTSPIARPVAEAVQPVLEELMSADVLTAYLNHNRRQESLRARFGRMMGVAPQTLGFVRNTSHGISIIAQAIPFQAGDVVVVPAGEYPSNVYPWMAQETRGVTVQMVPAGEYGLIDEDALIAACGPKTRVLAVSWVQWHTGQRMNLEKLGTFCRERSILFSVDMVQGLGAIQPHLGSLPVDFAVAGCHKWLLAPGGLGILYVRKEVFPQLQPTNIGWNSVERSIDWDHLHYDELRKDPRLFEEGTPALLATAALEKSVSLLEEVGFTTVEERVLHLARYARATLTEIGMTVIHLPTPAQESGIAAFRHPILPHAKVLEALQAAHIIVVERGGNLRVSPHVYNSRDEIEAAVSVVATVSR